MGGRNEGPCKKQLPTTYWKRRKEGRGGERNVHQIDHELRLNRLQTFSLFNGELRVKEGRKRRKEGRKEGRQRRKEGTEKKGRRRKEDGEETKKERWEEEDRQVGRMKGT
jgi:hypothetical protein